jgi:hypothetical protein
MKGRWNPIQIMSVFVVMYVLAVSYKIFLLIFTSCETQNDVHVFRNLNFVCTGYSRFSAINKPVRIQVRGSRLEYVLCITLHVVSSN